MTTNEYLYYTVETNRPRELRYGILREPPAPFFRHQAVVFRVARRIADVCDDADRVVIAPIDVILDADQALIVQPDVLFVSAARASIIRDQIWGAPDLVVEVLSPGTAERDRTEKRGWYRQYGVREYWLIDTLQNQVTLLDFSGALPVEHTARGDTELRSSVVPHLTIRPADILD